jgi:hypothetical protein
MTWCGWLADDDTVLSITFIGKVKTLCKLAKVVGNTLFVV